MTPETRAVARDIVSLLVDLTEEREGPPGERMALVRARAVGMLIGLGETRCEQAAPFDLAVFADRKAEFWQKKAGPGLRTAGICTHIRKELKEIEAKPTDLEEWIDIIMLGLDGASRTGASGAAIVSALVAKDAKCRARTWPDWRTLPPDAAVEHDRTGEAPAVELDLAAVEDAPAAVLDAYCRDSLIAPWVDGVSVPLGEAGPVVAHWGPAPVEPDRREDQRRTMPQAFPLAELEQQPLRRVEPERRAAQAGPAMLTSTIDEFCKHEPSHAHPRYVVREAAQMVAGQWCARLTAGDIKRRGSAEAWIDWMADPKTNGGAWAKWEGTDHGFYTHAIIDTHDPVPSAFDRLAGAVITEYKAAAVPAPLYEATTTYPIEPTHAIGDRVTISTGGWARTGTITRLDCVEVTTDSGAVVACAPGEVVRL